MKAMATDPQNRYPSPRHLAEEIERWVADEPVTAWREPIRVRLRRWARRHRTAAAVVVTVALLLAVGLTTQSLRTWHRLGLQRQQIDLHIERGQAASESDDFDQAISEFAQAEGLSRREPQLASLHATVQASLDQLERHRQFQSLAKECLGEGIHALRDGRKASDPIVTKAEQALALYKVLDDEPSNAPFEDKMLTERQRSETQSQIADLLYMTGIRLAMYDTHDEAGHAAARRALQLFDRAESLKTPPAGIWLARMLFHRRLGEDQLADQAGETMTRRMTSEVLTGFDLYLLGIVTWKLSGRPEDARDLLVQATTKDPNNYGANFSLFGVCEELGDIPGQLSALNACLALRPDDSDCTIFVALACSAAKSILWHD